MVAFSFRNKSCDDASSKNVIQLEEHLHPAPQHYYIVQLQILFTIQFNKINEE